MIDRNSKTAKNLITLRKILYRVAEGKVTEEEKPKALSFVPGFNRNRPYCQQEVFFSCGTPACAMGWFLHSKGMNQEAWRKQHRSYEEYTKEYFPELDPIEVEGIFASTGCDMANASARKAARYVGRFIKENVA